MGCFTVTSITLRSSFSKQCQTTDIFFMLLGWADCITLLSLKYSKSTNTAIVC